MLRIRWPVSLALALALLAPAPALADEVNPVESFTGGITDLFTGESRESVEDPVRDYEYEPSLRADDNSAAALPEEGQELHSVITAASNVSWGGNSKRDLLASTRYFLYQNASTKEWLLLIPAGLVFMWWGVRKTKNMVINAWRRGRATA